MDPNASSSMLRSPLELAVSETGRAARECADHLHQAAQLIDEGETAAQLEQLAARHEAMAERMAHASRTLGDLPRMPDADKETFTELVRAVKSAFASDERKLLIDECIADEHKLLAEIDKGLALDAPPAVREVLAQGRAEVEESLAALVAAARHD